ncbi:MAG: ketoacyl-ACP synthase III [Deltaproteobacteria bacterium]|nr:MAG: ketoacyl-ACP synthase III [Deltaproteobacteria bacterium]TDJ19845.1 MAG: ketoacyl-ACP synthase III [Deltaproteobacteria bacterium]
MTLWLHGIGHFHPENEITNQFLEDLDIGTSDAWIVERVGIRSRRTALDLDYIRETRNRDLRAAVDANTCPNEVMGGNAAEMALERAGLTADAIGMVFCGSSAPDFLSPADACTIAHRLQIDVPCWDVNSACTSFLAQIRMLSMMDPDRLPTYVLVVAPDSLTKTVDYSDRAASVLWGDAAAAAVLSSKVPGRAQILGASLNSRPTAFKKVVVPRERHFSQEGRTVQAFAIRETGKEYARIHEQFSDENRPLHFIGHQANLRMLENVCKRCDIPPERHHMNVEWFGNTGAASSASVLSQNWEKWESRDDIAVIGVGAGLTWASYMLRFGEEE